MQHALFDLPIPPQPPRPAPRPAATPARRPPRRADDDAAALQRWWRLQGRARQAGRGVEPLRVTPRYLARIAPARCPVTREPLAAGGSQVLPLRDDATVAAGHLVTLGAAAAATPALPWPRAWAVAQRLASAGHGTEAGLDAPQWRRLAVLRAFVAPLTPAQAAALPLHVLPPTGLHVLSPVQGLQVAATLALAGPRRAERLCRLALLARHAETRQALRVLLLTLLARCPADLDALDPAAQRQALEDLWDDELLARRWQRLALRLDDATATRILAAAHRERLLGAAWRPLHPADAVDGWDLASDADAAPAPAGRARPLQSGHAAARRPALAAAPVVARAVLGPGDRGDGADADARAAAGH